MSNIKNPMPNNARLAFKGQMFDVYQWSQKMFDGSFQTFERIKRPDTVNILPITSDNKIILTKQEQPSLQPFIGCLGGRVNKSEEALDAGKRELLEESGLIAQSWFLWDQFQFHEKIEWICYTYIVKGLEKVAKPKLDSGEKIELIEYSFDDFIDVIKQDNYRDLEITLKILKILSRPGGIRELKQLFI